MDVFTWSLACAKHREASRGFLGFVAYPRTGANQMLMQASEARLWCFLFVARRRRPSLLLLDSSMA